MKDELKGRESAQRGGLFNPEPLFECDINEAEAEMCQDQLRLDSF